VKLKTIIIAAALLAATSAQTTERYFVLASGAESCGTFIKAQPLQKSLFLIWAYGFITGVNSVAAGDQRAVGTSRDFDASMVWLEKYCRDHALDKFVEAAGALRDEFAKREKK
jgi:hypothetical protein